MRMNSQKRRNERYKILFTWKVLKRLVPPCGIEQEHSESHGRKCNIRPLKPKASNLREQSFQISGPRLFNKLPKKISDMKRCSVADFKEALNFFLTRVPDEPRAPGMTPGDMTEDSRRTGPGERES